MSFGKEIDYTVDFSRFKQDLLERARSRVLWQFQNSRVLDQMIQCYMIVAQELYDCFFSCLNDRTLQTATGAQLDMIGELVGQPRISYDTLLLEWFSADAETLNMDSVPIWLESFPPYTNEPIVDDEQYRQTILSKIFRNHVQNASVPELRQYIYLLTGIKCTFIVKGPLEVSIGVPNGTPNPMMRMLLKMFNTAQYEKSYLVPFAACTYVHPEIYYIINVDENGNSVTFMTDSPTNQMDEGLLMVEVDVNDY